MVSIIDKAKDRIRKNRDSDDESVLRSSSLSRSFSRKGRKEKAKDKEKEKKRLSGLRYENRLGAESKDSIVSSSSSRSKTSKSSKPKSVDPVVPVKSEETLKPIAPVPTLSADPVDTPETVPEAAPEAAAEPAPETNTEPVVPLEPVDEPSTTYKKADFDDALSPNTSSPHEEFPEPPLSSSTPNSNGAVNPNPIPVVDETQPLLGHRPEPTHNFGKGKLIVGLILVIAILALILYFIFRDSNEVILQSVSPQLNSINLLGFTNGGLEVKIDTSVSVNYDNISNVFYQNLYKFGGLMLGLVYLRPQLPITVLLNNLESFNVSTPPSFPINLLNKQVTNISFILDIEVSDTNLIKLLNELTSQDEVLMNVKSQFHTDIKTKFLSLKNHKISVDQDLIFENDLSSTLDVSDYDFQVNEKDVKFLSVVNFNNNVLLDKVIHDRSFELHLKDCDSKLRNIGSVNLSYKGKKFDEVKVLGEIDKIAQELVDCNSIRKLVSQLQQKQRPDIYLTSKDTNPQFPDWLNNIITNVTIKAPRLPEPTFASLNLNDLQVRPTNASISLSKNEITMSGAVDVANKYINIPSFHSESRMDWFHTESIGSLREGILEHTTTVSHFFKSAGNKLHQLLNKEEIELNISVLLESLDVNLPILRDHFEDLKGKFKARYQSPYDYKVIVDKTSVGINGLLFLESNDESLQLKVGLDLANSLPITIDSDKDLIKLDILSGDQSWGQINIDELMINGDTESAVTLTIQKTDQNSQELVKFINDFISSNNTQLLDVEFQEPQYLRSLSLKDIKLPQLKFNEDAGITKEGNPFILETVIHLIGSEVELVIYNPIENHELFIDLKEFKATYEDTVLGKLGQPQKIMVGSGINTTSRIPIILNAVGMDILKKAMNGDLEVMVDANFTLSLDNFNLDLEYNGLALNSHIKL